jgi:hypothetical protein
MEALVPRCESRAAGGGHLEAGVTPLASLRSRGMARLLAFITSTAGSQVVRSPRWWSIIGASTARILMQFEDLTSDRVRQLLLTLLREMDPEKYASFIAYFTFGGGGLHLMGAGRTPGRDLEELQGNVERADLLELRDGRYIRLEEKQDGTLEGRLTKRALDSYTEMLRETATAEEVLSGDRDVDELAEQLSSRLVGECGKQQGIRRQELRNDMGRRGILGSGIEEQGEVRIAVAFLDEYADAMTKELTGLVRKARGQLDRPGLEWIRRRIERDLGLLKRGQAGCYVKGNLGQRTLGDHIQRKVAGVASALEIELRTEALERRAQASSKPIAKDVFISYASEDKDAVARPIAEELRTRGFTVWYDDYEIKLGDSIPKKIDEGLGGTRFGVVVLSRFYFAKHWPKKELEALLQREVDEGVKVVLPVWHQVTAEDVKLQSKILVTKRAALMTKGLKVVVDEIVEAIQEAAKS